MELIYNTFALNLIYTTYQTINIVNTSTIIHDKTKTLKMTMGTNMSQLAYDAIIMISKASSQRY